MSSPIPDFFLHLPEPERSCIHFLRQFLKGYSPHITESIKVNTPFYYVKGKWLCFLSYHPVTRVIYLSFVKGYLLHHPSLKSEGRKQMKVWYVNAHEDIDIVLLTQFLDELVAKGYSTKTKP